MNKDFQYTCTDKYACAHPVITVVQGTTTCKGRCHVRLAAGPDWDHELGKAHPNTAPDSGQPLIVNGPVASCHTSPANCPLHMLTPENAVVGKTSLMSALAGKASYGTVTGSVTINGKPDKLLRYKRVMGFVPQVSFQ